VPCLLQKLQHDINSHGADIDRLCKLYRGLARSGQNDISGELRQRVDEVCRRWEALSWRVSHRSATSVRTDGDADGRRDMAWSSDTGRPEALFTELESAMDAASTHLLSAESLVDTASDCDTTDVDCVVSSQSIFHLCYCARNLRHETEIHSFVHSFIHSFAQSVQKQQ